MRHDDTVKCYLLIEIQVFLDDTPCTLVNSYLLLKIHSF